MKEKKQTILDRLYVELQAVILDGKQPCGSMLESEGIVFLLKVENPAFLKSTDYELDGHDLMLYRVLFFRLYDAFHRRFDDFAETTSKTFRRECQKLKTDEESFQLFMARIFADVLNLSAFTGEEIETASYRYRHRSTGVNREVQTFNSLFVQQPCHLCSFYSTNDNNTNNMPFCRHHYLKNRKNFFNELLGKHLEYLDHKHPKCIYFMSETEVEEDTISLSLERFFTYGPLADRAGNGPPDTEGPFGCWPEARDVIFPYILEKLNDAYAAERMRKSLVRAVANELRDRRIDDRQMLRTYSLLNIKLESIVAVED